MSIYNSIFSQNAINAQPAKGCQGQPFPNGAPTRWKTRTLDDEKRIDEVWKAKEIVLTCITEHYDEWAGYYLYPELCDLIAQNIDMDRVLLERALNQLRAENKISRLDFI